MKKQQGFSLIELLIVVGIIGTLTAIAIPAYTSYKDKSDVTAGAATVKSLLSGAAIALEEGKSIADYVTALDGKPATTTYTVKNLGTVEDATANSIPAMAFKLARGTYSGKTITYKKSGNVWTCELDSTITTVTVDGCS